MQTLLESVIMQKIKNRRPETGKNGALSKSHTSRAKTLIKTLMKKVLTITLCVIAVAFFSFFKNTQQSGIKKIGNNLYQMTSTGALKSTDEIKFRDLLVKRYNIKSFAQVVTVHFTREAGLKGNGLAMAEQKLSAAAFTQTILEDGDEEVKQSCIYSSCNANPSMGDVVQILSTYNVN